MPTHRPRNKKMKQNKTKKQSLGEKKKRNELDMGIFFPLSSLIFSFQFSFNFWEKTFWWAQGENT